ncbi:hypothetical protein B0T24DRAFT_591278 [Lasiosphaeria ovina]|uniref:Zn(2)-C6 fungal-type domain-containing protein n=1 Tax=Lasiosphaeria ovina TaxID=92902 RepID=A0AAE0N9C9_9PEZI|nr:hypothetical protein B0T24DRAFT_591278 [Lasiosphaeria ovina]
MSSATMYATSRSVHRAKQSRRSACDRCRTYKLRCERSSRSGAAACERCARTGAACTTTATKTPPVPSSQAFRVHHSSPASSHMRPFASQSVKSPSHLRPIIMRAPSIDQQHGLDAMQEQSHGQDLSSQALDLGLCSPMRQSSIDFAFANFAFPTDDPGTAPCGISADNAHRHRGNVNNHQHLASPPPVDELMSFSDSAVILTPPSPASPESLVGGDAMDLQPHQNHHPQANPMQVLLDLCARLVDDYDTLKAFHAGSPSYPSSGSGSGGNSFLDLVEMPFQSLLDSTAQFSDLLRTMALAEAAAAQQQQQKQQQHQHQQWRPSGIGTKRSSLRGSSDFHGGAGGSDTDHQQHMNLNRGGSVSQVANNNSSNNSNNNTNITPELMTLTTTTTTTTSSTSTSNSTSPTTLPSRRTTKNRDMVLTTTLVTTYVLVVRSWRQLFANLADLLSSSSQTTSDVVALLALPALQLGGLHVRSSPDMQLAVLLETGAGLLAAIDACLGISFGFGFGGGPARCVQQQQHWDGSAINGAGGGGGGGPQSGPQSGGGSGSAVLAMDPASVSVREMLLSQEMLRAATEDGGFGELTLAEMMDEVKRRLDRDRDRDR